MKKNSAFALVEMLIVLIVLGVIISLTLPNFMGNSPDAAVKKARNLEFGAQKSKIITTLNTALLTASAKGDKNPSSTSSNDQLAQIFSKNINIAKQKKADDGWIMLYTSDGLRIDIPSWAYGCKQSYSDDNGINCIVYVDLNSDTPPSDYSSYDAETYREGGNSDIFPVVIYDTEAKGVYNSAQIYRAIVEGEI